MNKYYYRSSKLFLRLIIYMVITVLNFFFFLNASHPLVVLILWQNKFEKRRKLCLPFVVVFVLRVHGRFCFVFCDRFLFKRNYVTFSVETKFVYNKIFYKKQQMMWCQTMATSDFNFWTRRTPDRRRLQLSLFEKNKFTRNKYNNTSSCRML